MPKPVRRVLSSLAVGFGVSFGLGAALLALDVAHLRPFLLASGLGHAALAVALVSNGIAFAAIQFMLAAPRPPRDGGRRRPVATRIPVRVEAVARSRPDRTRR